MAPNQSADAFQVCGTRFFRVVPGGGRARAWGAVQALLPWLRAQDLSRVVSEAVPGADAGVLERCRPGVHCQFDQLWIREAETGGTIWTDLVYLSGFLIIVWSPLSRGPSTKSNF